MQNIGPGPLKGALKGVQREAKRGLITTVGFKLRDQPACYALEGSIKIAGAALTWMRDNIQLIKDYDECDQLVNRTTDSAGVFFVPALGGLYSPYWDPNAAGLFIGLSQFTRREHLLRATFDSIAFQTNDILSLMRGVTRGLMIDGGLCKSDNMCQILADITGCQIVRPSMCETSALGAAMVAGCGAGIWSYESMMAANASIAHNACRLTPDPLRPAPSADGRQTRVERTPLDDGNSSADCSGPDRQRPRQTPVDEHKLTSLIQAAPVSDLEQVQLHNQSQARQITNRDAGGGVNDDAGGGVHLDDDNQDDDDDDDGAQLMTSISSGADSEGEGEDEDEGGVTTSGEFSSASSGESACNKEVQNIMDSRLDHNPELHEIPPPAAGNGLVSSLTDGSGATHDGASAGTSTSTKQQLLTLGEAGQRLRFARTTPSSGYSSSDNCDMNCFEELVEMQGAAKCPGRRNTPTTCAISTITPEQRAELVETWRAAVGRSMEWTKVHHEEIRRADYQRLSSMPVTMYLFLSLGMVALSGFLSPNGLFPKV